MAAKPSQADVLFERLRANGLRKRVARDLSQALSSAGASGPGKATTVVHPPPCTCIREGHGGCECKLAVRAGLPGATLCALVP